MKLEVVAKEFNEALKACFASTAENESILSCVCLTVKEGLLELAASDGNQMALRRLIPLRQEGDTIEGRYLIDYSDLPKQLEKTGTLEFEVLENEVIIHDLHFSKDGLNRREYPDLNNVVTRYNSVEVGYPRSSEGTFYIKLDRKLLLNILKNMKSTVKGRDSVVMKFSVSKDLPNFAKPCYIVNGDYDENYTQCSLLMPISNAYRI